MEAKNTLLPSSLTFTPVPLHPHNHIHTNNISQYNWKYVFRKKNNLHLYITCHICQGYLYTQRCLGQSNSYSDHTRDSLQLWTMCLRKNTHLYPHGACVTAVRDLGTWVWFALCQWPLSSLHSALLL